MSARIGATVRSFGAALAALFFSVAAIAQIGVGGPLLGAMPSSPNPSLPITATTITATTKFVAPQGTCAAPSYTYTGFLTAGTIIGATNNRLVICTGAAAGAAFAGNGGMVLPSNGGLFWTSTTDPDATIDTSIVRDGAQDTIAQKRGTAAQVNRLYFSTTGPVYWQQTARTAGVLLTGVGGAAQISTAQTTAPTCTTNCGTPGNVCVGTDTSMICTMGTTPASGFVVAFNGTWPAAPSCIAQAALTGMATGKKPLTVVTTTGQITVVTDGTAPVAGDKYAIHCLGVS